MAALPRFEQYQQYQGPVYTDLNNDNTTTLAYLGELFTFAFGATNALPPAIGSFTPLEVVTSGTSAFTIGGSGQVVFAQGQIIDVCPVQNETMPSWSGPGTRTDLISIQYLQAQNNEHTAQFDSGTGAYSGSVYNLQQSCQYYYQTNTTTPPSGYVAFATLTVPAGATKSNQATVTYLFETVPQLIAGFLGGTVTSVNSATGIISLVGGGTVTVTTSGNTIQVTGLPNVASVNGLTGALALAGGTGISVTASGTTVSITNTGVTGVSAGQGIGISGSAMSPTITNTGVIGIAAGNGIQVTGSSTAPTIKNAGVVSINGQTGTPVIESTSGTVAVAAGSSIINLGVVLESTDSTVAANPISGGYNLTIPFGRVGDVVMKVANITGNATTTLNIASLPAGTWTLSARAEGTMNSGNLSLSGSGGGGIWAASNTAAGAGGNTSVAITGTANNGQAPSATVTIGNQGGGSISFTLIAVRIS